MVPSVNISSTRIEAGRDRPFSFIYISRAAVYLAHALADSVPVAVHVCSFRLGLLKMSSPFMNNSCECGGEERPFALVVAGVAGRQADTTKTTASGKRTYSHFIYLLDGKGSRRKQERAQRQTSYDVHFCFERDSLRRISLLWKMLVPEKVVQAKAVL